MTTALNTDTVRLFWSQNTTLDGSDYLLVFSYNTREAAYYLQICLPDETVLANGIKLVSNYPLLRTYGAENRLPPGELVAVAYSGGDGPAALGELGIGQRVELTYVTAAELYAGGSEPWRNPGP